MNLERYRDAKKTASLLKLKAMRLRALGSDAWDTLVAVHEAARSEQRAAEEAADGELSRDAQIEACGLLLEARDFPAANKVWATLTAAGGADIPDALGQLYRTESERFSAEWRRFSAGLPNRNSFIGVRLAAVERVLAAFPGVAGFWWAKYRFHELHRQWAPARTALGRAIQLMPGNQRFLAMRMLLAVETSKPQFAEEQARSVWNEYRDTSADINQTFALTLLKLTRGVRRDAVLDDIVEATTRAERLATGTSLAPQASLLRAYAATLRGAVAPEELVEHIEGGRLNEAKVLQLCTPDWDGQTISHLAA